MIITRTPFRISFAGGGSDMACFYSKERGAVLSTAIDKYVYLTVNRGFGNAYRVGYSRTELTHEVAAIQHPIVRESLKCLEVQGGLEIVSVADIPAQSGMGSSSSFTVGLLNALQAHREKYVTPARLAQQACHIEIDVLQEPIGKQDQYIAAFGGFRFIQFYPDGNVQVDPVYCSIERRAALNARLMLFFTGLTRATSGVLTEQRATCESRRPLLRRMCEIAHRLRTVLATDTDLSEFGKLLGDAWELKKSLATRISNDVIDRQYERALRAGALGGKLLGAGNGGFLLFYCEPPCQADVRCALADLAEITFNFEPEGSKVIYASAEV